MRRVARRMPNHLLPVRQPKAGAADTASSFARSSDLAKTADLVKMTSFDQV